MDPNLPKPDTKSVTTYVKLTIPALPQDPAELVKYLERAPQQGMNRLRTAIRKKMFLNAYAASWGKVHFALEESGMSKAGYKKWRDEDPQFCEALEHMDGLFADQIECIIDKKILIDKDDNWLLKRLQMLRPERYAATPKGQITGSLTIHLDKDNEDIDAFNNSPNSSSDS